ncbi:(2Fe-2S)-binding protein [Pseudoflavonifractor sp. MSJ-37]|uniref:(2Fe-2S)-binding protein n=1 Tax=Pseudoflavonifractor sp. MSJ-37 TaxID=2841531 RepID=UPI001C112B85|nr:(2Fe-2S)-binding protein [Pseudoflavonifractor sp. MSJ-37]MBU5434655.1 (2Fe-2S)-binding protein [Pseudoflavonifractor sp. MSJ-37]
MELVKVHMTVNGEPVELDVKPYARLLDVLREDLALTGTKEGCGVGECGACTVLVDGENVNSCLVLASSMEGKSIVTVEGISSDESLHPIQQAFLDHHALQCGFCTPGLVMSVKALLDKDPAPSREAIKTAISGNLCRCTGYQQVIEAAEDAARAMRGEE